jgi:tRNA (mo5U34)-methyltransferase
MADVTIVQAPTGESKSSALQSRLAEFSWHHSIDLGGGVITPGGKSLEICKAEASLIFDRVNLTGCAVLDIGAWNGIFSFEAKRRGAARVLATDSYCWSHPIIRGRETFELARSALGVEVDAREIDVADLSVQAVGEFDIVLYLGVFYHRYDAIEALAKAARLAKRLLIVETHLELREVDVPAMAFFPGSELANDSTNWWGPNEHCMKALLLGHGFSDVEISAHPAGPNRAIFHAWRSTELRIKSLAETARLKPITETIRLEYNRRHPVLGRIRAAFVRLATEWKKLEK